MPYRYLFATHAKLQEYLAEAYVRERGIDPTEVLLIRNRGTYTTAAASACASVDGDRYLPTSGQNFAAHRRANRRREAAFRREVLDRCAPGFRVYSAMYTYWYLRQLRRKSGSHHVMEDGLGSFQSLAEFDHFFRQAARPGPTWTRSQLRRRLCLTAAQRAGDIGGRELFATTGEFLTTSPLCFPWVRPEQRVVLERVFPPQYVGQYRGATILGTSCLVEDGMFTPEAYLRTLGSIVRKIADLGLPALYFKLHPRQARGPHADAYRSAIRAGLPGVAVTELEQTVSIERLAAGNPITLITGLSTLAFHVRGADRRIVSYLDDLAAEQPRVLTERAQRGLAVFRSISTPL